MSKDRRCLSRRTVLVAAATATFAALAAHADEAPRLGRYEVRVAPIPAGSVIAILVIDTPSLHAL